MTIPMIRLRFPIFHFTREWNSILIKASLEEFIAYKYREESSLTDE
jgi:hypothetical protein